MRSNWRRCCRPEPQQDRLEPAIPSTSSFPPPPGGVRVWKVVAIALLAIVAALTVALGRARWHVRLMDVRFVDHREKV